MAELLKKLPSGWARPMIGDLCNPINGKSFKSSEWRTQGLPIIRIQNLKDSAASFNYFQGDLERQYLVEPGDLLFAWSGTPGTSFGAHVWRGPEGGLNQHIFNLQFDRESIDTRFLCYALNERVRHFVVSAQGGVGLAHITKSKFTQSHIMLAPLPEQHRIVEAIEAHFSRLDAAVAALKRVQANLKRYRASVLKAACEGRLVPTEAELARKEGRDYEPASKLLEGILEERRKRWEEQEWAKHVEKAKQKLAKQCRKNNGEDPPPHILEQDAKYSAYLPKGEKWKDEYPVPGSPRQSRLVELPPGWTIASLLQLGPSDRPIAYGVLQPGPHVDDGVPLVRVSDVDGGRVDIAQLKRVQRSISDKFPRTVLSGGEVLLTVVGSIGRTAVVPSILAGANTARAVAVLPLLSEVDPRWVELWLRNPERVLEMTGLAHEVARKTLNLEDVRVVGVALPPATEQQRIVSEVERRLSVVDELEAAVAANLKRAERLRQAILKRAFEGRLVPTEHELAQAEGRSYETAEQLLARIKATREAKPGEKNDPAKRPTRKKPAAKRRKVEATPFQEA